VVFLLDISESVETESISSGYFFVVAQIAAMRLLSNGSIAAGFVAMAEQAHILLDLDDDIAILTNISETFISTIPRQMGNISEGLNTARFLLNSNSNRGARQASSGVTKTIVLLTSKRCKKYITGYLGICNYCLNVLKSHLKGICHSNNIIIL